MKKILFMAVVAIVVMMASCGGSSKEDAKKEYVEYLQKALDDMKNVTTVEEWQSIATKMQEDGAKLIEKHGSDVITALNEDEDVKKINEEIMAVVAQKQAEVLGQGAAAEQPAAEEGAEAPAEEEAAEEPAEETAEE